MKIEAQSKSQENELVEAFPLFRRGKRISTPRDMSTKEMMIAGILGEKPSEEVGTEKSSLLKDKNAVSSDENFNV